MMKAHPIVILGAALAAVLTQAYGQQFGTYGPAAPAYRRTIYQLVSGGPTQSYGLDSGNQEEYVGNNGTSKFRALYEWDSLSTSIPAGATIDTVEVQFLYSIF